MKIGTQVWWRHQKATVIEYDKRLRLYTIRLREQLPWSDELRWAELYELTIRDS